MYRINEIFYSLQGEGFHTGTPAVFVRFSSCNLRCTFCDTQHQTGKMMSLQEIVDEVNNYPIAPLLVLTGGEVKFDFSDVPEKGADAREKAGQNGSEDGVI